MTASGGAAQVRLAWLSCSSLKRWLLKVSVAASKVARKPGFLK